MLATAQDGRGQPLCLFRLPIYSGCSMLKRFVEHPGCGSLNPSNYQIEYPRKAIGRGPGYWSDFRTGRRG